MPFQVQYNDLRSVEAAVERAGDDLAAIVVSPFRHDARFDQELCEPAFARGLRAICDRSGAVLILDDVRAGFRLSLGGSWEPLGVRPDLAAYSKAIANGYPLAAVLGSDRLREGAARVYATGSFWTAAVPMAAALATIATLRDEQGIATMERMGTLLREGLARQAASHDLAINQTGPVQLPFLTFAGDEGFARANLFTGEAARRLPASLAQLVPQRGAQRRRHSRRAGAHRRGVRRRAPPLRRGVAMGGRPARGSRDCPAARARYTRTIRGVAGGPPRGRSGRWAGWTARSR